MIQHDFNFKHFKVKRISYFLKHLKLQSRASTGDSLALIFKSEKVLLYLKSDTLCAGNWHYFHKSCYFVDDKLVNWTENYSICQNNDGKLISLTSDLETSFVKDLVRNTVPTVSRYEDFMIKKIIFLGFFSPSNLNSGPQSGAC